MTGSLEQQVMGLDWYAAGNAKKDIPKSTVRNAAGRLAVAGLAKATMKYS